MMHDAVTNSQTPATKFFSHKSDDFISPNQAKTTNMLTPAASSRRAPSAGLQKSELSAGSARWRFNNTGQLVDSAAADWDIADELVKMKIGDNGGDPNAQMRTSSQSRTNPGALPAPQENSPLETTSETSFESESPNALDQPANLASHSRGSSADTTGSALSATSQTLRAGPYTPLKVGAVGESRNRPHSYSGGLSTAELTRLQLAGGSPKGDNWSSPNGSTPERQQQPDQPTYPSLANQNAALSRSQEQQQFDLQSEYQTQQRQFSPQAQAPPPAPAAGAPYPPNRQPVNVTSNMSYRQAAPRSFDPRVQVPGVIQSPTNFAYPAAIHPASLSITNPQQQLYDMMLATPPLENPAMARLQQQHGAFRPGHQHSASDPASLRDPATLALINNNLQAFAASQMYPPAMAPPPALSLFANQFYSAPQDAYPAAAELAMMARLQAQYTGTYGVHMPGQNIPMSAAASVTPTGSPGNGPSANNRKLGLYKTELCRSWEEKGTCRYGAKCQFAHGEEELRKVQRHPKYKTEICRTFWVSGSCPYGKRCCFIHTELPGPGAPGQEGAPPPQNAEGRGRSGSTNSDPNEVSTSLLARIAKRNQEGSAGSVSTTPPSAGFSGRPGSLRVDTSVLDATAASAKQNKSAYPTFAHNGILMPANDDGPSMSPGPVTAAPDFGRHAASRIDIVGTQRMNSNSNPRHSFNGSDVHLDFSSVTPTATSNSPSQFGMSPPEPTTRSSRINGHVRSGSAGNWGSTTRTTSHLTAYPLSSIPGGEAKANSPWADYGVGSRLTEKTWV